MNQKMTEFYDRVRREEDRIKRLILAGDPSVAHQPQPTSVLSNSGEPEKQVDAVYVTSVDNFDRLSTAGLTCAAPIRLAATRIVESTHRLATVSEVAAWRQRQVDQKSFHDSIEASRTNTFRVTLPVDKAAK